MNIKCNGIGCSAINGENHSVECGIEHDLTVSKDAGNRNPEARYAGYKKLPLRKNATNDERSAWAEGFNAAP